MLPKETLFNNKTYDFYDTGYKIHLPVVPDSNDTLTRKIVDFLDQKYGLNMNTASQYGTEFYKVGEGGQLQGGTGITLYGRISSMQEMKDLAEEIEKKFGKELADNVKKYNLTFHDPIKLTNSVQARFAVYGHNDYTGNNVFGHNYRVRNKSGALPLKEFTTISGEKYRFPGTITLRDIKCLSNIDEMFFHGDSTMYAIDNFGELFTGECKCGKVPSFVMDGLPKEYLEHYNLSEKDIISRINKGTKNIVAAMLKDAVENPNSKILTGKPPWLATLDMKILDGAKQLLAQYEPETLKKLEQIIPQLTKKCPALKILEKTGTIPKNQLAKELDFADAVTNICKNSKICKAGLYSIGAVALAGVATSIFVQRDNKELLAINKSHKQANTYGSYFSIAKRNMMV